MSVDIQKNAPFPNEFTVEVDDKSFLIEVNKQTDNTVFLFCKPLFGEPKYFFMGKDEHAKWVMQSRFTIPQYILAMENLLSEKVTQIMNGFAY